MLTADPIELLYDDPTQWRTSQIVAVIVVGVVAMAAAALLLLFVQRRLAGQTWYRRSTRVLLGVTTATSLLLFLATATLLVRGYAVHERLVWEDPDFMGALKEGRLVRFSAVSGNGRLTMDIEKARKYRVSRSMLIDRITSVPPGHRWFWDTRWRIDPTGEGTSLLQQLGFDLTCEPQSYQNLYYAISFPMWLPALMFAAPPVARFLRRRRHRPGFCRRCGYDLTGNVSGVCPECGNTE